jgi:putative CocE/NonD family hydrolase
MGGPIGTGAGHRFHQTLIACILLVLPVGVPALLASTEPDTVLTFPALAPDDATLPGAIKSLALSVIPLLTETDQWDYFDNLFRLQLAAGLDADARASIAALRRLPAKVLSPRPNVAQLLYDLLARIKVEQPAASEAFEPQLGQSFASMVAALDDQSATLLITALSGGPSDLVGDLRAELDRRKGTSTVSVLDALRLIRAYEAVELGRALEPFVARVTRDHDRQRYLTDRDVIVKTSDGASICVIVVRPRTSAPIPALMQFTIYADADQGFADARQSASHGYAGVVALTRGKGCGTGKTIPYVRDGADADEVINWIARQPWNNRSVGMYGGSYSGETAWAAAKHPPKALKAIMVGAPGAPGIDVPMEGNVAWSFVYPWPFYTTNNKLLDNAMYNDDARWERLTHDWYVSGRPYRDLERIDGTPNPIFAEWLDHPSYDSYWQQAVPYRKDFAQIDIPVLQTAGYYSGGPGAAVHYLSEHYKYHPNAEHYLVIGPYDHFGAQRGTLSTLRAPTAVVAGYPLDPAAQIDLWLDLRFRWFDYALRGAPKPDMLQNKINYEVTGANTWKHAPSLAAMAAGDKVFYLSADHAGTDYLLSPGKSSIQFVDLKVDLKDRSDANAPPRGGDLLDKAIDTSNGLKFVGEPLQQATEFSGLFSGNLDVATNKRDFDFQITLYELTAGGDYFLLAPYWSRASYVGDLTHRTLLVPNRRTLLRFQSQRLMSHQLQKGSRVIAVVKVIKNSGQQINYGTGGDVSSESVADAGEPLTIRFYRDSRVSIPIGR